MALREMFLFWKLGVLMDCSCVDGVCSPRRMPVLGSPLLCSCLCMDQVMELSFVPGNTCMNGPLTPKPKPLLFHPQCSPGKCTSFHQSQSGSTPPPWGSCLQSHNRTALRWEGHMVPPGCLGRTISTDPAAGSVSSYLTDGP